MAEITIHSYPHGGAPGIKPRKPMVHLLTCTDFGSVGSITFHPDDAPKVADAILKAGRSARAERQRKPVTIEIKPHD